MRKGLLKSALLGAAALGAVSIAGAGVARANLIQIGFATSMNGATPTNFQTADHYTAAGNSYTQDSVIGKAIFSGSVGIANVQTDVATGSPTYPSPQLIGTVTGLSFGDYSSSKNNTLWVYITESGLQAPLVH